MPASSTSYNFTMPSVVSSFSWPTVDIEHRQMTFTAGMGSAATLSTSNILLVPLSVTEPYRVRRLWWANGTTVAGNVDVGVFDEAGNRLVSAGTTNVGNLNTVTGAAVDYTLGVGRYWMGIAFSSATHQTVGIDGITGAMPFRNQRIGCATAVVASPLPLPSQITIGPMLFFRLPIFGIASQTTF